MIGGTVLTGPAVTTIGFTTLFAKYFSCQDKTNIIVLFSFNFTVFHTRILQSTLNPVKQIFINHRWDSILKTNVQALINPDILFITQHRPQSVFIELCSTAGLNPPTIHDLTDIRKAITIVVKREDLNHDGPQLLNDFETLVRSDPVPESNIATGGFALRSIRAHATANIPGEVQTVIFGQPFH
ncbi:MAG: hypothetical protein Q7J41_10070 [Acetobacterium sp.]|nr:hypothetical protein [Acetobacterium sp.]MDO9492556.1 hypothetical protein [Acetobacterium sp.]